MKLLLFFFFSLPSFASIIETDNPSLKRKINAYFENKTPTKEDIENYLIKKSFLRAEVEKKEEGYLISNPVQSVFVFKGEKSFKEAHLLSMIKESRRRLGPVFFSFLERTFIEAYKERGFFNAQISQEIKEEEFKEWIYVFISEGSQVKLATLEVKGFFSRPSSEYERYIRRNSGPFIRKGFYSKKDLEQGTQSLILFLKSEGWLQSKIYSDRVIFEDDQAFVYIYLREGPLTFIKDIQIKNTKDILVWEILQTMESKVKSVLKIGTLKEDLEKIEKLYQSRGYMNMKIRNEEDIVSYKKGDKYAKIVLDIHEGEKAYISQINIEGLKKTRKGLIRALLDFKEGDLLTPKVKDSSLATLGASGLFHDVSFQEEYKGDQVKIHTLFNEKKLRSLKGAVGAHTERGFTLRASSDLSHRNLFGWGRALSVGLRGESDLTEKEPFFEYQLSSRYKEVFWPAWGVYGNLSFIKSRNVFSYEANNIKYVNKTQLGFYLNKDVTSEFKVKWALWSFEQREEACTKEKCPENPLKIGNTDVSFVIDTRDNIFAPQKGIVSSIKMEWALPFFGSSDNIHFLKTDLSNRVYLSLTKDYIIALSLRGGFISSLKQDAELPVSRSFILGGQSSIRGYDGNIDGERIPDQKSVPIDTANEALSLPLSSDKSEIVKKNFYGLTSFNFSFPLLEDFKTILFYDLGAVYLESATKKLLSIGQSVGIGFRYQIFLIPVGLDIAYKLAPKEGEEDYRWHLSMGW